MNQSDAKKWLLEMQDRFPTQNQNDKEKLLKEFDKFTPVSRTLDEYVALIGIAIALRSKERAWRYATEVGWECQWGSEGVFLTLSELIQETGWKFVRHVYMSQSNFENWRYEAKTAKAVYDIWKQLEPSTDNGEERQYKAWFKRPDAEFYMRPIPNDEGSGSYLLGSVASQDESLSVGIVTGAPDWERFLALRVNSDFLGMFTPDEIIGAALSFFAEEWGFASEAIRTKSVRDFFETKKVQFRRECGIKKRKCLA